VTLPSVLSRDVNEKILNAITRGLERMGKNVSAVSYWKFKQDTGLEVSRIPLKPEEFVNSLSKLFGPGYPIIESSIGAELKREFELNYLPTNNFRELVAVIRKNVLKDSL
jgi:hypothetical protein